MLWVLRQNSEPVRDSRNVNFLLILEASLQVLVRASIRELLVAHNLPYKSVARDDVTFYYLAKAAEFILLANSKLASDGGSLHLITLDDVDVDEVLVPEFPSERDSVLAPGRRPEEELSRLKLSELRYGASRADVLKLLVGNPSRNEAPALLRSLIGREILVNQVIFVDLLRLDSQAQRQVADVLLVRG